MSCWLAGCLHYRTRDQQKFFCNSRRWSNLGTQPTLWAKVDLTFKLYSADHQARNVFKAEREGREIGVQIEDFDGTLHICGWREELRMVLTLPRLGLLKHLNLVFFIESVLWRDCIDILQLVSSAAPSVRKLSWKHATINPDPNPAPTAPPGYENA